MHSRGARVPSHTNDLIYHPQHSVIRKNIAHPHSQITSDLCSCWYFNFRYSHGGHLTLPPSFYINKTPSRSSLPLLSTSPPSWRRYLSLRLSFLPHDGCLAERAGRQLISCLANTHSLARCIVILATFPLVRFHPL